VTLGDPIHSNRKLNPGGIDRLTSWIGIIVFLCLLRTAQATLDTSSPVNFFTNVASRLLQSDLNLDLNRIQVYPTNQYTPSVHRVLQVTANLYDATTNRADTSYPFVPSVFRPLFRQDTNGTVFIAGYREAVDAGIASGPTAPAMIDLEDPGERSAIPLLGVPFNPAEQSEPLVSGISLVIGAKKGFPNFNKFALQNEIKVIRKLHFHRAPGQKVSETNQMHSLMISNSFGMQAWNSYSNFFPRDLHIIAAGDVTLSLTNELGPITLNGIVLSNRLIVMTNLTVPANSWTGFANPMPHTSFLVPLVANHWFLTNAVYIQSSPSGGGVFVTQPLAPLDPANLFRVPRWWLNVRIRLRFVLVDSAANRIVDYVNLDSSEPPLNLTGAALQFGSSIIYPGFNPGSLWMTNRLGNPTPPFLDDTPERLSIPTYGVWNQFLISLGLPQEVSTSFWQQFNATPADKHTAIVQFQQRIFGTSPPNDFEAPFNPMRTFYQYIRWEANDPLVHYTVSDLTDFLGTNPRVQWDSNSMSPLNRLLAENPLNDHYRPWGGNPLNPAETSPMTQYNPAIKDPLIYQSDSWDFPSNTPLNFEMLGRVHRGTPWQTVYLKSPDTSASTWVMWLGNTNVADAMSSRPINDRLLVDLFDLWVNHKSPHQRISVNSTGTNAWLSVLHGVGVLTNSFPESRRILSSNSPQAQVIAAAILRNRSTRSNQLFASVGDILSTPELSSASPWLDTNVVASDRALERIPARLLPLIRFDSVGSIQLQGGQVTARFTGYDGVGYVTEVSSNLSDWITVSTHVPTNNVFSYPIIPVAPVEFHRSKIQP
jgi:hypothetical protein